MVKIFSEKSYFLWMFLILVFLGYVLSQDLSFYYIGFVLISLVITLFYSDGKRIFINKYSNNTFSAFTKGLLAFAIFMFISGVLGQILQYIPSFDSLIERLLSFFHATTPILADSKIMTVIGWGIMVPIIETKLFFGDIFDTFARMTNTPLTLGKFRTWLLMLFISFIFMWFHLQAKGLKDNVALMMTVVFGVMSMALVIYDKLELESAIWFHIINNTAVVASSLWTIPLIS